MRVKGGPKSKNRHRKVLKRAKGYRNSNSRCYTHVVEVQNRALVYAYRDRKVRKRDFRSLWTIRINAAARLNGTTYSKLIGALTKSGYQLDRKVLADLAVSDPSGFSALVQKVVPTAARAQ